MLSDIQKNIILRAVKIREGMGEDPEEVLKGYTRLTDEEREDILKEIGDC